MSKNLELRMYGLVTYNISPIQQGIQFGHAVVEYGQMIKKLKSKKDELKIQYDNWAENWKTFIICNGGTTNSKISKEDGLPLGSLNKHAQSLSKSNIKYVGFFEPDLGDQLTAIVFIVDERVFNRKKYPDFKDWILENYSDLISIPGKIDIVADRIKNSHNELDQNVYKKWLKMIGGEKNEFLRDFLKDFKLA